MFLYTPGHGAFLDGLIMYSIVGSLIEYLTYKGVTDEALEHMRIKYTGNEYIINLNDLDVNIIVESIVYTLRKYEDDIVGKLIDQTNVIQKQSRGKLISTLSILTKADLLRTYIIDLSKPLHMLRANEGRLAKPKTKLKLEMAWLALMPSAGKFYLRDYGAEIREYKICLICKGLSLLGLYLMGLIGSMVGDSLEIIPIFDGEVKASTLKLYRRIVGEKFSDLYSKISKSIDVLPDSLTPRITLLSLSTMPQGSSLLREMKEANASWHMVAVRLTKGATQLRGFEELNIDPLINTLTSLLRDIVLKLSEIVDEAINRLRAKKAGAKNIRVDADTIDLLFKFLEYRESSLLYKAIREIYKDDSLKRMLSLNLVINLAPLII